VSKRRKLWQELNKIEVLERWTQPNNAKSPLWAVGPVMAAAASEKPKTTNKPKLTLILYQKAASSSFGSGFSF
jgi:hypothetical protein